MPPSILEQLDPGVLSVAETSKFSPKLSYESRCGAIALLRNGVPPRIVAQAFKLHPQTVKFMAAPSKKHYPREKAELEVRGLDDFVARYVNSVMIKSVNEVYNRIKAANANGESGLPNRGSRKFAGEHTMGTKVVKVFWGQPNPENSEGWFWDDGQTAPIGPFYSSLRAFNDAKNNEDY